MRVRVPGVGSSSQPALPLFGRALLACITMADNTGTTSEPQAEAPVHSDATADVATGEPSTASAAGEAGAAAGDAPATPAATNAAIDFVSPASQASPTPDASPAADAAVNGACGGCARALHTGWASHVRHFRAPVAVVPMWVC